ncbi:MAG: hypothetical protein UT21_C0009G0007 [Candidatus Woesebacteria bacterium GW2011_GWA1_39_11b]|nr:MAG: hypothetical protein UT21_C0009G0007 [Candidatus Woesebacteria bacterium GW2011_GWA1_39_11b]KKS76864.1 MAG: seg [Candidatus Woesebacteria bacterium GW2011_GWC1_42_9]
MQVLLIFILIVVFGYLFSSLIIRGLPLAERGGLSYLLGMGIVTLLLFFSSWVGIKITAVSVLTIVSGLIALLLFVFVFLRRKVEINLPNVQLIFRKLSWPEKIICLVIGVAISFSLLIALYYPVYVWDALALYDFTAKIVAQTGYFVQIANQYFYFAQYPLLVPLGHTIVYLFGGSNPQFIYSLYFFSFAVIFYSVIRKKSSRLIALFATLLLVTNPILFAHSTIAYTNLPYTTFYVIGIIYLYTAVIRNRLDYLFISSLLIGFSTWARSAEPLWLTEILIVLIYAVHKKSIYPALIFLFPFLVIQQPWNVFQARLYGLTLSTVGQLSLIPTILSAGIDFKRILDVSLYIYRNIIQSWGPIFMIFLIVVFFDIKNRFNNKSLIMLLIILANFMAVYIGTYLFSIRFEEWKAIPDSAVRMSMFFPPLMIYYISLVLGLVSSKSK